MTSESKDIIVSDDCIDSPSFDEASSRGGNMGNNLLKKGPWTIAEDAILVKYVNKHGEGNWSAVQKHYGLSRCGKSCRLRWYNHLRPDLKKGSFTHDEERRIIELHAKMGNKWARIAAELPGRTDNEIKNFWNTRIKKLQRASLPIYPPDAYSHAFEENQQSHNIGSTFSTGLPIYNPYNFDNPAVEFQCFEVNQTFYFDSSENIFGPSSSSGDAILSSSLNGNFSTLGPAPKIELPSLQYLSDFESDDTLIQSPPSTDNDSSSPLNNGLLESILYESQCLKRSKKNYFTNQQYSDDGDDMAVVGGGLTSQLRDADWAELYYSDSISPLGHSATSVFTEYTTPASGISSDDPVEIVPSKPAVEWDDPKQYGTNTDISDEMKKYSRPDLLLESSNWFGPDTKRGKDHSILTDAIGQLLGEDSFT